MTRAPRSAGGPRRSRDPRTEQVEKFLKIEPAWQGLNVSTAVRRAFSELQPRDVFALTRKGLLRRNGERCHPLDRLNAGDLLAVTLERPVVPAPAVVRRAAEPVVTAAGPFFIVREDDDLLAVSKPPGCASHPALGHSGDTLLERIRCYLQVATGAPFQPALANRLDLGTSGLVLVGKNRAAQRALGRALQQGTIDKHYLALVGGRPPQPSGEIRLPLMRHRDSRGRPERLQPAATRYRLLEQLQQPLCCALLEVELLTGRTHQIRRHLTRIGNPVAGDRRYGDPRLNNEILKLAELDGLFLHAWRVELAHPRSGEPLALCAPLPQSRITCLRTLGGHPPPPPGGQKG